MDLFEAERSVEQIARVLGRAYATTFHALTVLRVGILAHGNDGDVLAGDPSDALLAVCRHRGHKTLHVAGHVPVFGILDRHEQVTVSVLPEICPDTVLSMPVKKVRRGNIVYTGMVGHYDALMFSASNDCDAAAKARFARSPAPIDALSGFWAYAVPRLTAHHGISAEYFTLYIKELEFRYNHRGGALAPLLLRYLCDLIPPKRSRWTADVRPKQ